MTGPQKRGLVVDTIFLHNYPFNNRATNQKILDKFRVHTTALVKGEVERKLKTTLPPFIFVHETDGRNHDGLSAADDSLLRLQKELRSLGQDALLVSFDTALIKASPAGRFGDQFFTEIGIKHPQAAGKRPETVDVPTLLGLLRFGVAGPITPWTEREVRHQVATTADAKARTDKAARSRFKEIGSWKVTVSEYTRADGVPGESWSIEDRGSSYVVRWRAPHPGAQDRRDVQWWEGPAKRDAGAILAQHGFTLVRTRKVTRRALARRGTKILHEEENGQNTLVVESRSDPILGPDDDDHAQAVSCIGAKP